MVAMPKGSRHDVLSLAWVFAAAAGLIAASIGMKDVAFALVGLALTGWTLSTVNSTLDTVACRPAPVPVRHRRRRS